MRKPKHEIDEPTEGTQTPGSGTSKDPNYNGPKKVTKLAIIIGIVVVLIILTALIF